MIVGCLINDLYKGTIVLMILVRDKTGSFHSDWKW